MKKTKKSLEMTGLGILALACFVGLSSAQSQALPKRASFSIGGVYATSDLGFSYQTPVVPYTPSFNDTLGARSMRGTSLRAGFALSPRLELFLGTSFAKTGAVPGEFTVGVAVGNDAGDHMVGSRAQDRRSSQFDLLFGLRLHLAPRSRIDPYAGIGACWTSSTIQAAWNATWTDQSGSTVTVGEVSLVNLKTSSLGAFATGGLEIGLGRGIAVFVEGLYRLTARKSVVHPWSYWWDEFYPRDVRVGLGGFVASAGISLRSQTEYRPLSGKGSFSFGGVLAMSSPGFAYINVETNPYYDESLTFADRQERGRMLGYSLNVGYFVAKKAELFGGLSYAHSGRQNGRVSLDLISPYSGSTHATAFQDRRASRFDLNVGAKFHISPEAGLDPYFGFGGCYASAAVQLFKSATFGDYLDSIGDVRLEDASTNALGGFAIGGIEVGLGPGVSVYAESVYKIARKAVRHPFSEALQRPLSVPVNMGGLTGSIGLKIRL